MKELNYNQVMPALKAADQDFTEARGCGAPFQEWDAALEASVIEYNAANGTDFDPVEARHQYIEDQEDFVRHAHGHGWTKVVSGGFTPGFETSLNDQVSLFTKPVPTGK